MKVKNIKILLKTLITATIISMSIINICFADDIQKIKITYKDDIQIIDSIKNINDFCEYYKVMYNGIIDKTPLFYEENKIEDDNNDVIINYSNGSKYFCNLLTSEYWFKPLESNSKFIFNNIDDLNKCRDTYKYIKENSESQILKYSYRLLRTYDKKSNINYTYNLQTDKDLEQYAKKWLRDNYNIDLNIPIYYSEINTSSNSKKFIGGLFNYDTGTKNPQSIKIELEYKNVDFLSEKTLVHELTHYALFVQDKEFDDGTDSFTNECIKNGVVANNGYRGIFTTHLGLYNNI